MDDREQLLRRAYDAFNVRDIDGALALMHPDVDWPNAWEGGRVRGHGEVRDYWTRQFAAIDSHVEPVEFGEDDQGRVVVDVHQVVRNPDGEVIADQQLKQVYAFRDGLVERMDVIDPAGAR